MPDEDPGDVFLHQRAAVLDALLSDPSLTGPGAVDPLAPTGVVEPDELFAGELFAGELPELGDSAPPLRGTAGPTASERILALLNGEQSTGASGLDFTPPTVRTTGQAESESENNPPDRPDPNPSQRFAALSLRHSLHDVFGLVRKPKVALGIGAALVVLLVVVLVFFGGGAPPERPVYATATPGPSSAAPPPTAAPTTPASAALSVKAAQSHCPPGGTPGMDAFAGPGKAWSCPRAYKIDGQVLTIDLGGIYTVESIGLVPGWDSIGTDGADQWSKYRTASRITYQFDDPNTTVYTQQTLDQRSLVVTTMKPPVRASRIILTVVESKGDPTTNITALSSIVITGH